MWENLEFPQYTGMSSDNMRGQLTTYYQRLQEAVQAIDYAVLEQIIGVFEEAYVSHRTVFVAGNGWSWATASHFAADFVKTIFGKNPLVGIFHHPFNVVCLWDNIPTMTATGNDLVDGYNEIFSLPLLAKAKKDDVLLVITGSWNSGNILQALNVAHHKWMKTVGFLWFDGGKALSMLDVALVVQSSDYWVIEDMHSTYMHVITDYFKKTVGERYSSHRNPVAYVTTQLQKEWSTH